MDTLIWALSWLLLCGGGAFVLIGGIGVIRMPNLYTRIHAAGLTDSLGPILVLGGLMAVFVMEYARQRYFVLFVLNVILILYAVYGFVVPGMFYHPGLSWTRIASAMSVEMATGVFSRLPQLALTLIGSFILVLSVLRAFGCIDALLKGASRIAARSPHALPQAAVVGSTGVAAISGSGAANAVTTGSATIPAMIAAGMPRENAAAVETASSLGGQLMPPIMGISAFLMAEFLGRSYFDVVARGYAPALIYFAGVSLGVYLTSVRHPVQARTLREPLTWPEWIRWFLTFRMWVLVFTPIFLPCIMSWRPAPSRTSSLSYSTGPTPTGIM